jgi:hypothetical protein
VEAGPMRRVAGVPKVCQHYRCVEVAETPVLYAVLGSMFERWLCQAHARGVR